MVWLDLLDLGTWDVNVRCETDLDEELFGLLLWEVWK